MEVVKIFAVDIVPTSHQKSSHFLLVSKITICTLLWLCWAIISYTLAFLRAHLVTCLCTLSNAFMPLGLNTEAKRKTLRKKTKWKNNYHLQAGMDRREHRVELQIWI